MGQDVRPAEAAGLEQGTLLGSSGDQHDPQVDAATSKHMSQKEKLRSKNRRAQKAYRERQKAKLTDSEEQMKTLTAHLESLVKENGKLQSRIALMVQSIRLSQEKVVQDRERKLIEYRLGAPYTEDMVVTLSFVGAQQQRMSVNDIRGLGVDKLAQLHKGCVGELSLLMVKAGGSNTAVNDHLQQVTSEFQHIAAIFCSQGPEAMHQMTMMRAPDSLFSKGSVPNGHWAECVAELQLTPEQVQHLFSIREAFCKRAAALRDQRRALIRASTQGIMDVAAGNCEVLSNAYMGALKLVEQLQECSWDEHILRCQVHGIMWSKVLTSYQVARFLVVSYPWAPQAFGLIDALAAQQGMPPCTEVIDALEGRQDVQQVLQATASYSMQAAPHLKPPASVLQLDC
ncbi:hypothetical protein WJX74_000455 [Apatococcus lobatus]|uniref:BZIP domain-containing protein n=1 Tax=Apatococcus lobatus TaxID=904363 RepID=A0AAW1RNY6_9CHLO